MLNRSMTKRVFAVILVFCTTSIHYPYMQTSCSWNQVQVHERIVFCNRAFALGSTQRMTWSGARLGEVLPDSADVYKRDLPIRCS
jgi:hypothetical protein